MKILEINKREIIIYTLKYNEIARMPLNNKWETIEEDNEYGLVFKSKNNKKVFAIVDYHEQNCCEDVFVAWSESDIPIKDIDIKINHAEIRGVEDYGLRLEIYGNSSAKQSINIPAYNRQNGYYSDQIALRIVLFDQNGNASSWIDIDMTGITQDEIR